MCRAFTPQSVRIRGIQAASNRRPIATLIEISQIEAALTQSREPGLRSVFLAPMPSLGLFCTDQMSTWVYSRRFIPRCQTLSRFPAVAEQRNRLSSQYGLSELRRHGETPADRAASTGPSAFRPSR